MRLVIHRDGRVLVHEHGEADRLLDNDDPLALAEAFRAIVELENGLTSAQLFRALRPWAALLARAAWLDFNVWQASATRAPLRLITEEPNRRGDDEPPLDAVVIHPVLSVHQDGEQELARASIAVHWRTSGGYATPRPNGFGGEDLFCSLSFAPPESWTHLPLLSMQRSWLTTSRCFVKRHPRSAPPRTVSSPPCPASLTPSFSGFSTTRRFMERRVRRLNSGTNSRDAWRRFRLLPRTTSLREPQVSGGLDRKNYARFTCYEDCTTVDIDAH
jgi:hypothetical protein